MRQKTDTTNTITKIKYLGNKLKLTYALVSTAHNTTTTINEWICEKSCEEVQ